MTFADSFPSGLATGTMDSVAIEPTEHAEPSIEEAHVEIDNLAQLLAVVPERLRVELEGQDASALLEIILDLGRPASARYTHGSRALGTGPVSRDELAFAVSRIGRLTSDNRAGIEGKIGRAHV